jgi:hypothetical protein
MQLQPNVSANQIKFTTQPPNHANAPPTCHTSMAQTALTATLTNFSTTLQKVALLVLKVMSLYRNPKNANKYLLQMS